MGGGGGGGGQQLQGCRRLCEVEEEIEQHTSVSTAPSFCYSHGNGFRQTDSLTKSCCSSSSLNMMALSKNDSEWSRRMAVAHVKLIDGFFVDEIYCNISTIAELLFRKVIVTVAQIS